MKFVWNKKFSKKPCRSGHGLITSFPDYYAHPDKVYRKLFCPKKFSGVDFYPIYGTWNLLQNHESEVKV
jgi:hypothetical protein